MSLTIFTVAGVIFPTIICCRFMIDPLAEKERENIIIFHVIIEWKINHKNNGISLYFLWSFTCNRFAIKDLLVKHSFSVS